MKNSGSTYQIDIKMLNVNKIKLLISLIIF